MNSKDILLMVINDTEVNVSDKRSFCNKLLRKALFHGNVDVVELVLKETKGIGRYARYKKNTYCICFLCS